MEEILAQKESYINLERDKQVTANKFSFIEQKNKLLMDLNVMEVNLQQITEHWQKFLHDNGNYQEKVQHSI